MGLPNSYGMEPQVSSAPFFLHLGALTPPLPPAGQLRMSRKGRNFLGDPSKELPPGAISILRSNLSQSIAIWSSGRFNLQRSSSLFPNYCNTARNQRNNVNRPKKANLACSRSRSELRQVHVSRCPLLGLGHWTRPNSPQWSC